MAIHRKSFEAPDSAEDYDGDGVAEFVQIGETQVMRSTLKPGWSWERNAKPYVGADFCPMYHNEYVVSGRILYRLKDGSSVEARQGDFLIIEPGHAGEVQGDEACVIVDW